MDQKSIGAFIARCRKDKNLTQLQLADMLGVTSQAISKWENGRGMPDVSLLQPLCDILGISLNELFSADYISNDEYKEKAEENISKLFKEKQQANFKPVKNLFSVCANVTLTVVIVEVIVGIVGYFFDKEWLEVMMYNALVWLVLFALSFIKVSYDRRKMKSLKNHGVCVEANINEIISALWIRVGNYHTARVKCDVYYEGKEYSIVSGYFVLKPFVRIENLCAYVYFDKRGKYIVELYQAN